jgi:peptidoglycan/xylan/chitin deacetylase (PgdA/CDA1 family)
MQRGGLRIGAHTRTHPLLVGMSSDRVAAEMQASRSDLESRFQAAAETFAYPYGEFDDAAQRLAEQAGYQAACGLQGGLNRMVTPWHALRRTEVDGRRSLPHFLMSLWTGMPWPLANDGRGGLRRGQQLDSRPETAAQ